MPRPPKVRHPLRVLREIVAKAMPDLSNQNKFANFMGISPSVVGSVEAGRFELSAADRWKITAMAGVAPESLISKSDGPKTFSGAEFTEETFKTWWAHDHKGFGPRSQAMKDLVGESQAMLEALIKLAAKSHGLIRLGVALDAFFESQVQWFNDPMKDDYAVELASIPTGDPDMVPPRNLSISEAEADPEVWNTIRQEFDGVWMRIFNQYHPGEAKVFSVRVLRVRTFHRLICEVSTDEGRGLGVMKARRGLVIVKVKFENAPPEWKEMSKIVGRPKPKWTIEKLEKVIKIIERPQLQTENQLSDDEESLQDEIQPLEGSSTDEVSGSNPPRE